MACKARRCGDEMQCGKCGLTWELTEENKPACREPIEVKLAELKKLVPRRNYFTQNQCASRASDILEMLDRK